MIRFLTSSRQYKLSKSFIFHFLFITFGLLFQPRMFLIRWRFLFWVCFLYFQIVAEEIETQTRTFTLPCQRKRRENHLPHTVSRLNSHSAPISGTILLHIVSNCSSCHSLREKKRKRTSHRKDWTIQKRRSAEGNQVAKFSATIKNVSGFFK